MKQTCSVQIVAVSNDITYNSGAFGTKEDAVFRAATEHALEEKLPLIYLAANAGARVGLAQEVKQCLQVTLPAPVITCLQTCTTDTWRACLCTHPFACAACGNGASSHM
jgi:hypothetical protein